MKTEIDKNDNKPSDFDDNAKPEYAPECVPGCACEKPAGKGTSRIKIAVCLLVFLAVVVTLVYKTTRANQNSTALSKSGFPGSLGVKSKGPVFNSAGQQGGSGAALAAIADLNTFAEKLDTVFLVIPSKDNAPPTKEASAILAAVERTLNAKGLSTGIYTLQATSADYPDVAAKVTPPGIAVLTKGRGIGFASGGMSETKLMQAYVVSTSGGGCGPGGCPPPGGGKVAAPCN